MKLIFDKEFFTNLSSGRHIEIPEGVDLGDDKFRATKNTAILN